SDKESPTYGTGGLQRLNRQSHWKREVSALRRRKSAEIIEQKKYTASMFGIAPKLRICGDRTVMIEFEQTISPEINDAIHGLAAALENANISGIVECTPCYCSLGVHYDPLRIQCHDVMEQLSKLLSSNTQDWRHVGSRVEVPVVYGGDFGPDLEWMASTRGL